MCGLAGIVPRDPREIPDEGRLLRMARALAHRGPDDEQVVVRPGVGLAFRRLSILDLAGGAQPLANEAGDVLAVGNGEIYGFRELRRDLEALGHRFLTGSDMEVLVHLYEEHGDALVARLDGMFAFAVADLRDPARPRVLLGRDRLGIKPLYHATTDREFLFASEPKALLEAGATPRRLRASKLLEYLVQGFVGGEEAAWEGMRRLLPAHTLSVEAGEAPDAPCRYWDAPLEPTPPAAGDEILAALDRAVDVRRIADVPLGVFLSGGIDSTAVATSLAMASEEPIVACSVGFRERTHDELDQARRTAARLGAVHHTAVLDPDPRLAVEALPWLFDEPLADPSTVPTFLVSRMAREHVTVALAGDGGDEVFAGYRRHVFAVAEERVRRRLGPLGRRAAEVLGRAYPKLDWAPRPLRAKSTLLNLARDPARAYYASFTQLEREEVLTLLHPDLRAELADWDPFERFEAHWRRPRGVDDLYRAQYADLHGFLPERILTKTDRASMGVSLEVRVPMLDHRIVERFAPLPEREKVRRGRGKHALREALRGRVPAEVLDGAKRGFDTPLTRWTRRELRPAVEEAVATLPPDWFDLGAVRARLGQHLAGARDHAQLLWSLLVLEHWRRRHEVTGVAT